MKRLIASFAVVALVVCSAVIAEELKSGLNVGESVDAFNVSDCTGPAQGKAPLCYRCRYGNRPTVCVFAREVNDNLAALIKQIDESVGKNEDKKMAAFVVMLTEDSSGTDTKLKALAAKNKIENVPLTTFADTKGPASYEVAAGADVTVMMWTEGTVKANHSFAKGKLNKESISKILADTSKILN